MQSFHIIQTVSFVTKKYQNMGICFQQNVKSHVISLNKICSHTKVLQRAVVEKKIQNGGFNPHFQTFFIRVTVTIVFKVHSCLFRIIETKQQAKAPIVLLQNCFATPLKITPKRGEQFCKFGTRMTPKQDRVGKRWHSFVVIALLSQIRVLING